MGGGSGTLIWLCFPSAGASVRPSAPPTEPPRARAPPGARLPACLCRGGVRIRALAAAAAAAEGALRRPRAAPVDSKRRQPRARL